MHDDSSTVIGSEEDVPLLGIELVVCLHHHYALGVVQPLGVDDERNDYARQLTFQLDPENFTVVHL